MNYTSKDLGETPKIPNMSTIIKPLEQTSEGNIFIEHFTITTLSQAEKNESLAESIKKESKDSSI